MRDVERVRGASHQMSGPQQRGQLTTGQLRQRCKGRGVGVSIRSQRFEVLQHVKTDARLLLVERSGKRCVEFALHALFQTARSGLSVRSRCEKCVQRVHQVGGKPR